MLIWTCYQETQTEREGIYFFTRQEARGNRTSTSGERCDNKSPWNTDCSRAVFEILALWKNQRQQKVKFVTMCFLVWTCWTECPYDWITEMNHWKEGCTVSQREAREETNICWAFLGPGSACKRQGQDLNPGSAKFKAQVISQQAKEMSQLHAPPGMWTSKHLFQQVILVSTDGNCVQGWGKGQQLQCLAWRLELQELFQTN